MFDGNANDLTGYGTGTILGTTLPSLTQAGYVSLSVTLSSNNLQYVWIPSINFAQQSFTIQVWIYTGAVNISGELGIFGQCDSSNVCLSLSLRNARFALSFDAMNANATPLLGSTLVTANVFTHVTAVYDATLLRQALYVNGLLDARSYGSVAPYRGSSSGATTTIGRTASTAGLQYFNGLAMIISYELEIELHFLVCI